MPMPVDGITKDSHIRQQHSENVTDLVLKFITALGHKKSSKFYKNITAIIAATFEPKGAEARVANKVLEHIEKSEVKEKHEKRYNLIKELINFKENLDKYYQQFTT